MTRKDRPRRKGLVKKGLKEGRGEPRQRPSLYSAQEEESRARALGQIGLLDTPREERFDRICRLVQEVMQAPATYISLIDRERQWFKSTCGMGEVAETPREGTFCDYAIRRSRPTVVLNATEDPFFSKSPYVTEGPKVRFYAGFPLVVAGQRVGTLCALDFEPRTEVTPRQMEQFSDLAQMAQQELARAGDEETLGGPPTDGEVRGVSLLRTRLFGLEPLAAFSPQAVVGVVNLYLEAMIEAVHQWQGRVDDLSGGALRAIFVDQEHEPRAAACAIEIQKTLAGVHLSLLERQIPPLLCGIGLHSGQAIVGSLGSRGLWKPSLLGAILEEADQLETLIAGGQILATGELVAALGELAGTGGRLRVTLASGKVLELFELEGVGDLRLEQGTAS